MMWKEVPGFPAYEADDDTGQIRRASTKRLLRPRLYKYGRLLVQLSGKGKCTNRLVARLIWETFQYSVPDFTRFEFRDGDPYNCALANIRPRIHKASRGLQLRPIDEVPEGVCRYCDAAGRELDRMKLCPECRRLYRRVERKNFLRCRTCQRERPRSKFPRMAGDPYKLHSLGRTQYGLTCDDCSGRLTRETALKAEYRYAREVLERSHAGALEWVGLHTSKGKDPRPEKLLEWWERENNIGWLPYGSSGVEVHHTGQVRSIAARRILVPHAGRIRIDRGPSPRVDWLVYHTHIEPIPKYAFIEHLDGNPDNNHVDNLRYHPLARDSGRRLQDWVRECSLCGRDEPAEQFWSAVRYRTNWVRSNLERWCVSCRKQIYADYLDAKEEMNSHLEAIQRMGLHIGSVRKVIEEMENQK